MSKFVLLVTMYGNLRKFGKLIGAVDEAGYSVENWIYKDTPYQVQLEHGDPVYICNVVTGLFIGVE